MTMLRKGITTLILLVAAYGSFSLVSSLVDREPPIAYESASAVTPSVELGKTLDVEFTVFRKRICDQTVKRILTDSKGVRHSISAYTVGIKFLAGRERYKRSITIPSSAALGAATYQVTIDYNCTATQRLFGFPIEVSSPPISFEIVPSTGPMVPLLDDDNSIDTDG